MSVHPRVVWGLAGLLAFEALLAAYTFSLGAMEVAAMSLLGAALLAVALWRARQGAAPSVALLSGLAIVMLARALWQVVGNTVPPAILVTFAFPVGFALLAVASARRMPASRVALLGIVLVAFGRTWFAGWYLLGGNSMLVALNLIGAVGAWAWASVALRDGEQMEAAPA